ncbi:MAG: DNA gyrase inhibitor YacG [Rhodoferax sp.]|nr:DNA gyrase inhibitor YacG [Rhodoferax sp.]
MDSLLVRSVPCPACGGESVYGHTNPHRPFCCRRCQGLDLGHWANEEFRVKADSETDPAPDAVPAAPQ